MGQPDLADSEYQQLNSESKLDFFKATKTDLENAFLENDFTCEFFDEPSICAKFKNFSNYICLSSNVQSLSSKFSSVCNFFTVLHESCVIPDIFAVQEVWTSTPDLHIIPGYSFYCKTRKNGRGEGSVFMFKMTTILKFLITIHLFLRTFMNLLLCRLKPPAGKSLSL